MNNVIQFETNLEVETLSMPVDISWKWINEGGRDIACSALHVLVPNISLTYCDKGKIRDPPDGRKMKRTVRSAHRKV